MVFPIIPVLSGVAGLGAGAGIMGALGGGKKEEIHHAPYEYYAPTTSKTEQFTYAPQVQYSPQLSYAYQGGTYIISSPSAVSKKQQEVKSQLIPEQSATWEFPISTYQQPTHSPVQGGVGTDLTKIAIIAVIGLVAYGFITKKK